MIDCDIEANDWFDCWIEGRDKFCKMIQYGSRFIKYQADGKNQDVFNAFKGLFGKSKEHLIGLF